MLFESEGHVLLFNDQPIGTFFSDHIVRMVAAALNDPIVGLNTPLLRNELWNYTVEPSPLVVDFLGENNGPTDDNGTPTDQERTG